ncbi:MAG: copper-translocating P-type ATPase [Acutalibacteraceae bacterium]|nr:copper-translocating P-type ATPase [Acutalibacteraceae bacterium]
MKTKVYDISGMSCAACSASVTRVVSRLEGVTECDVNLIAGKMTVTFDEERVGDGDFVRVVEKAGFGIAEEKTAKKKEIKEKGTPVYPIVVSLVFTAILLIISMGTMLFESLKLPTIISPDINPYNFALTQFILCLPALYFGRKFFIKGLPLLFKGHPNMDSLVGIGATVSLIYSIVMTYTIPQNPHAVHNLYYESVAVVISLVMLGKFLEEKSRNKTLSSIKKLMELTPETAIVRREGKDITLPTEQVEIGDILVIKEGSKIPLDGVILEGETSVDESMLTGESLPVNKVIDDPVTGGSLNLTGFILVRVTRKGEDTTLAKIIKFVEEAGNKKAPISKTADKVAGVFVPIVIGISLLSALIWLIAGKDIGFILKIMTSVLVVACPCSLGLATPTAVMVGTGLGASNGILIRNGEVLETLHNTRVAVFDKTGTVTEGVPKVTDIVAKDKKRLLTAANYGELYSVHPIAKAILEQGKRDNIICEGDIQTESVAGKGISCVANGNEILVGSREFLEEKGIEVKEDKAEELARQGKSLVFVAENKEYLGLVAVADSLKVTSVTAIKKLKSKGVKTVLLSGDNKLCAEYIGSQLGVDEVYSEVLPTEKSQIIEEIRKKYGSTLMVGDGINDAPALTSADVGCAIGNGSDIAIESADIVLMKSDPEDVARAVNLSKYTIINIKENLFWAFCYNSILIPVAAGVLYPFMGILLSPMLAGLAMSLSSICVVTNALRLKLKEKKL